MPQYYIGLEGVIAGQIEEGSKDLSALTIKFQLGIFEKKLNFKFK